MTLGLGAQRGESWPSRTRRQARGAPWAQLHEHARISPTMSCILSTAERGFRQRQCLIGHTNNLVAAASTKLFLKLRLRISEPTATKGRFYLRSITYFLKRGDWVYGPWAALIVDHDAYIIDAAAKTLMTQEGRRARLPNVDTRPWLGQRQRLSNKWQARRHPFHCAFGFNSRGAHAASVTLLFANLE